MASSNIIGRKAEIESLTRLLKTGKSEFIALYGRRRVGKSFLVNELYKKKNSFYSSRNIRQGWRQRI